MDKFVKEAEFLKSRLADLDTESNGHGDSWVCQTNREEYNDVILDVRILIDEFGNKAIIDELHQHQRLPNPNDLSYLLGKLIETANFRNR